MLIIKAIFSVIPELLLVFLFVKTWQHPGSIPWVSVDSMALIMLLEFIVIHSAGFMGAILVSGAAIKKKVRASAGLALLYLVFAAGFAAAFESVWPLLAFLLLMLNRLMSIFLRKRMSDAHKSRVMAEWAMAVTFYLLAVFATLFIPLDPMGATTPLSTGGSGEWERHPHIVLAAGALYFCLMSIGKFVMMLKANQ